MKKSKILFNAFVEASNDAHIAYLLYSEEVWGRHYQQTGASAVHHTPKWEDCPVDSCRMRYELAAYMARKM